MTDFRFIHAADIHLDSPLDHLRSLDEATAKLVATASRRSVERLVATALQQQVAAVIIAGDLFDGPVRDASAALWVDSQFRKLAAAGIDVVLIRGNHDALSNASRSVKWSTGVIELGPRKRPRTFWIAMAWPYMGRASGRGPFTRTSRPLIQKPGRLLQHRHVAHIAGR